MDSSGVNSSSSSSRSGNQKAEPDQAVHELLEESWFFGKLLQVTPSKPKMLRCYSDPSPNFDKEILPNISPSTGKLGKTESTQTGETESSTASSSGMSCRKLTRQLSDQIMAVKGEGAAADINDYVKKKLQLGVSSEEKASDSSSRSEMMIIKGRTSRHGLLRTPSLPPCIGREEMIINQENEGDEITMSKLIRQAMPLSSDRRPRQRNSKVEVMPKHKPPRNSDVEISSSELIGKNQRKLEKSLSNVEFSEVQGFKDLGFTFEKPDYLINPPSMVGIFAGLQEKKKRYNVKRINDEVDKVKEAHHCRRSCSVKSRPIIPAVWAAKDSAQDMKAQLKFWARAVASNVR